MGERVRKIRLKTNFMVPGTRDHGFPLPGNVNTIAQLLAYLGGAVHFDFIDPESGELEWDLEILLNGRDYLFSPAGLETALEEGAFIEIYLLPLGGG